MRGLFERGKAFYVKGTLVGIKVPFTGESDLFRFEDCFYSFLTHS